MAGEIRNTWGRRGRDRTSASETERIIELVGLGDVAEREVSELPTARGPGGRGGTGAHDPTQGAPPRRARLGTDRTGDEAFGRLLRELVDERDLAICLVEHDVGLVMGTCGLIHVLDYGEIIASGTPEQVKDDPVVINAYLGAP